MWRRSNIQTPAPKLSYDTSTPKRLIMYGQGLRSPWFHLIIFSSHLFLYFHNVFDSTSLHSILFCFKHFNVLQGLLRMGTASITALSPNAILNQKLRSKNEHSLDNLVFSLRWKNSYRLSHLNARCHHRWFIAKILFFYREQKNKFFITENNIAEIFPNLTLSYPPRECWWKPDGNLMEAIVEG